jgi:hypothetical protein
VNAPRHNDLIQESFYSGHKKFHGIKYLSLEAPNGMCTDLHGPEAFRFYGVLFVSHVCSFYLFFFAKLNVLSYYM